MKPAAPRYSRVTTDELWAVPHGCRMEKIIRPYVESLA